MADTADVRRRKPVAPDDASEADVATPESSEEEPAADTTTAQASKTTAATRKPKAQTEDVYSPWVDILRVLTFLLLASCALSYLVSSGESWFWGMKNPPKYLRAQWWKSQFNGPLYLTPEQLAAYDGTDPSKPIYLAINHTIYDVTAGARIYGPGGSYNVFAGVDASRGYVTGCFAEDRTPDMRGAEEMYLPLDDSRVDRMWPAGELAALRVEERRVAKEKVHHALKHWVDFFAKSKKYHFVGYVKREEDWLKKMKRRKLCDQAAKARKAREPPQRV